MVSRLENARQNPDSMIAGIINAACRLFGTNGVRVTTTRMIAADAGVDVSARYDHWGAKQIIDGGVIAVITENSIDKSMPVDRCCREVIRPCCLEITIDVMCDFLFSGPGVSNRSLFGHIRKADRHAILDLNIVPTFPLLSFPMRPAYGSNDVSLPTRDRIRAIWDAVLNFISGGVFSDP